MSASVDEAVLAAELEAVREASRAGEIVAVHADDERSMARYVAGATLRLTLFGLLLVVVTVVAVLLG
ncbi:MAG TPA: hypothetical protein VF945_09015 [Polyangia bacterium]